MKKLVFLFVSIIFITYSASSQNVIDEKCGTMPSIDHRIKDLEIKKLWEKSHENKKINRSSVNYDTTGYVVIPVVFHVVHNPAVPAENIPDSLIFSQIDVLNQDHTKTHPYISSTLAIFDSISSVTGVKFCLATVDPFGNPTTGITRTSSSTSHLLAPFTNSVKSDAAGGKDPWPRNFYLNIWSCEMAFGAVLGYAQFPWDAPATDGVVLHWKYVGEQIGSPTAPSNLGRTMTHEGGHWLGMRHIWGDGACGIEDGIHDTPDSDAASAQDCMLTRNDCDDAGNLFWKGYDPEDNVQNYMDYSADACMTMFTRNQTQRMWHYIIENRDSLFYSYGCDTPKLNGYVVTRNITCSSSCDGEATAYVASGTPPFSYLWDDPLAQTDSLAIGLCKGNYKVRIIDADGDTIFIQSFVHPHDYLGITSTVSSSTCDTCIEGTIIINAAGGTPPYTYSFEGGPFQSSNTFDSLIPGTYSISVLDSCGTLVTSSIIIENTIGISEMSLENQLSVYPNPVSDLLSINLSQIEGAKINSVHILNYLGNTVYSNSNKNNQTVVQLSVKDLANGCYILNAQLDNGNNLFVKFLKISN